MPPLRSRTSTHGRTKAGASPFRRAYAARPSPAATATGRQLPRRRHRGRADR